MDDKDITDVLVKEILNSTINLYKEGAELLAFCGEKLKTAEQQVKVLVKKDDVFFEESFDSMGEE